MADTKDINDAVNYFEERTNKIHYVREKMEEILRGQLLKFMNRKVVHNVDAYGNIQKKTGAELLSIDVFSNDHLLSNKSVLVGQVCQPDERFCTHSFINTAWLFLQKGF